MSNPEQDLQQKQLILARVWALYETVKDVLIKAEVQTNRLPEIERVELEVVDMHLNKVRNAEQWLKHFIVTHITPWQKLRRENTEDYWKNAELMGFDNSYAEIKLMRELSKKIRKDWFTGQNILYIKKEKKSVKGSGEIS